jgi:hypothetical protein
MFKLFSHLPYFIAMVKMSEGTKERLSLVINVSKYLFRWGFIPTILYLGVYDQR